LPSSTPSRSRAPVVLLAATASLYVMMVLLSVEFALARQAALDFHERDFPYYAQFDVRAFDARYDASYSLSPNGHDLFGFVGTEGVRSLHQAIHFEPVKYVMALLFRLTGRIEVVFGFVAAVFFAPMLLFATRLPKRDRLDVAFAALAILAYALYPSALEAATFDLRPFSLLMPLFAMSVLSVLRRRPARETLFFFNALFLVREEALIFGVVVLLVGLALDQTLVRSRAAPSARPPLGAMIGCFVAWTAVEIAYFAWCGYGNVQPFTVPLAITGFALSAAGGVVLVARRLRSDPRSAARLVVLPPLTLLLVFAPLGVQQIFDRDLVNHPNLFLFAPMYSLHAGCVLLALVATWTVARSARARTGAVALAGTLVAVSLGALASPWHRAPLPRFAACETRSADAALVFDVREETTPLTTSILTDQATFQAFYDYENVFVYERLPWGLVAGEDRRWPRNQVRLTALVAAEIEWIVITRGSHDDLARVLEGTHLGERAALVAQNDRYEVYRIDRR
jgi:hypothetical protein